jgi:hypothetical protein
MARVLRYDGLLPNVLDAQKQHQPLTPEAVAEMSAFIQAKKPNEPFDIVVEGETPGETPGDKPEEAAEVVRPFAEAGATWWLEARWQVPGGKDARKVVAERIAQGPPSVNSNQ